MVRQIDCTTIKFSNQFKSKLVLQLRFQLVAVHCNRLLGMVVPVYPQNISLLICKRTMSTEGLCSLASLDYHVHCGCEVITFFRSKRSINAMGDRQLPIFWQPFWYKYRDSIMFLLICI